MKSRRTEHSESNIRKMALLIGLACVLQISESLIPHPVPGLRLGLANMMTLVAMVVLGFGYALEVAVLRTVLSAFILGTFMSPTFLLSLGGAVASTFVMGFFYWVSGLSAYSRMSLVGISIIGAFVHNLVQLVLAYALLVKHAGIFVFFPWLSLGAVATGWVVGVVASGICRKLLEEGVEVVGEDTFESTGTFSLRTYVPGQSPIHRLPADIKFPAIMVMALLLLCFTHFALYLGCAAVLLLLLPLSGTPLSFYLSSARKYRFLLMISLFLPMFFNSGTHVLMTLGAVNITDEGFRTGLVFASRILFLILFSALLMRTTQPSDLIGALTRLLWPLRFVGVSRYRTAALLSQAWTALPRLWDTTRQTILSADLKRFDSLKGLIPALVHMIATLYMKTESPQEALDHRTANKPGDSKTSCVRNA